MNKIMVGTWAWGTGKNGSKFVFGKKRNPLELRETFYAAIKCGFQNWDTAASYGAGTCEEFLGELMDDKKELMVSTKYCPGKKFKQGELTKSFEASCIRLKRKQIDLFWIHIPRNLIENIKEVIPLQKAGRIGKIGIANVSLKQIKEVRGLLEAEGLSLGAVQNHFSLLRSDQGEIIEYCKAMGIDYYEYMVLEQGALSGHYSAEHPFPKFHMYRNYLWQRMFH